MHINPDPRSQLVTQHRKRAGYGNAPHNGEILSYGQKGPHAQPTVPKYHAERSMPNVELVPGHTKQGSEQPGRDQDISESYESR